MTAPDPPVPEANAPVPEPNASVPEANASVPEPNAPVPEPNAPVPEPNAPVPERSRRVPLLQLVAVMDRLRSPGGCAWDARQTHASLAEYLLEECHETLEAIETGDDAALREELGDLLLQVVFHARIAQEGHPSWGIDDVAAGIVAKLVRRHPHVFGEESPHTDLADVGTTDDEVLTRNWSAIKAREQGRDSALDGIPRTLPALALAQKTWRRAREAGLVETPPDPPAVADDAELGDALLRLVVAAETAGMDAESALRGAARRLAEEVRAREAG